MADKKITTWQGHPILHEKDAHELELKAAVNEFHHGQPRQQAERNALDEYRREKHARAAAHHLQGMRASNAVGAPEDAQQHHALYRLHLRALGHEAHEPVPNEVKRYADGGDDKKGSVYSFKGHGADQYLVQPLRPGTEAPPPPEPVQKSEDGTVERLRKYLLEVALEAGLAKGSVVPFPAVERQPTEPGAPAPVQAITRPQGYGRAMRSDDYSHLLPEDARAAGYTAFLDHHGYSIPDSKDGYAVARLMHRGTNVSSQWAYPHSAGEPRASGVPTAAHPEHHAAAQHLRAVLGAHAEKYKAAWQAHHGPAIQARTDAARETGFEALDERTNEGQRSLKQAFRPRNQPMKP